MEGLKGKVALITGGARGIGRAIGRCLADYGCDIVVSDIDAAGAEAAAKEMEALGVRSMAVQADVSHADQTDAMIKTVIDRMGKIDILVNNAGITRDGLLMRMSEADWDLVLKINLTGAFICTKAVIRHMMKRRSGKIINMASVVGVGGNVGQANYSASKAGLIGFTKSVAKEVASRNIQANAVAPGYIVTEMTDHVSEEAKAWFLNNTPLKRPGTPEDVARAVAFLASSASDYITGQVLHVDGGMMM